MDRYQQRGQVDPKAFQERMQQMVEQTLQEVMQAVNDAPDGQWIEGSEDQVADVMAKLRQKAYETALQMRVDAAEAAFPPSKR